MISKIYLSSAGRWTAVYPDNDGVMHTVSVPDHNGKDAGHAFSMAISNIDCEINALQKRRVLLAEALYFSDSQGEI
jgi:hypothetical protein